jgi:predicted nucleotide-binding protein
MNNVAAALANLAGIRKAVVDVLNTDTRGALPIQNFGVDAVGPYFTGLERQLALLQNALPELYEDFVLPPTAPLLKMAPGASEEYRYSREQVLRLARDIDQIFEIRSNSELTVPLPSQARLRCVFISHGRANAWREVQAFIEKDLGLQTLELAQEPNQGRTVLAKLAEASNQCDSAVIVMTGDDLDATGQPRARENVIHEIGFFQGKYGLDRICLLHEEGTNIPSNIHGLVYAPFPQNLVSASFGLLMRELRAMYR